MSCDVGLKSSTDSYGMLLGEALYMARKGEILTSGLAIQDN